MSFDLWTQLPDQFLRMKFARWQKLDHDVRNIIVELANKQKFKCAICGNRNRNLVVDHDHEPEEGPGDRFTIYNIRGLVCQGCNWDLGFYEKEARGEAFGWDNADCNLSDRDYERYIFIYERRAGALREALLEKRIPNYWTRRIVLERFDSWFYEGGKPPGWYMKYKEEQNNKIETPEDALNALVATFRFINEQFKANPNYEPPDEFWKLFATVRPLIEKAISEKAAANGETTLSPVRGDSPQIY